MPRVDILAFRENGSHLGWLLRVLAPFLPCLQDQNLHALNSQAFYSIFLPQKRVPCLIKKYWSWSRVAVCWVSLQCSQCFCREFYHRLLAGPHLWSYQVSRGSLWCPQYKVDPRLNNFYSQISVELSHATQRSNCIGHLSRNHAHHD